MISRRQLFVCVAGLGTLVAAPAAADTWRIYRNARFGTSIEYPDRFRPGRPPDNGGGLGFTSADTASFSVYGSHNALEHNLAELEAFVREGREAAERITYRASSANWFVLSGTRDDTEFYERYLLSHGQRIVNGFDMRYPARLRRAYDPVVTRMSRSLRAGRGVDTEGNP